MHGVRCAKLLLLLLLVLHTSIKRLKAQPDSQISQSCFVVAVDGM